MSPPVYCLQELVANSLAATRGNVNGRTIVVALHKHKDDGTFAITVHDDGMGMDEVRPCGHGPLDFYLM